MLIRVKILSLIIKFYPSNINYIPLHMKPAQKFEYFSRLNLLCMKNLSEKNIDGIYRNIQ
jgi:hypothetical protein